MSNGVPRVTIDAAELYPGCVRFTAGDHPPSIDQLPFLLERTVADWLAAHPDWRITAALPISITVWYTRP